MRVDVSQETDPGDPVLEVPWVDSSNPRRRYVDLKQHPEAVADLEECRDYPALGGFLRAANSGLSAFRSAKCEVWETSDLTEDERLDFGLPYKVGSYVDLVLDAPKLNDRLDVHQRCAETIAESLSGVKVQAQLEIPIRRCLFHPEERWGYSLTIFTHAYGETAQEAKSQWVMTSQAIERALEKTSLEISGSERGPGAEC